MKIGEVSLNTNDVVALANFYKQLFGIDNGSNDAVHQVILSEGTWLTIYNDGSEKRNDNENISLAFTVDDIESEYQKLLALGVEIIEKPTKRPWGNHKYEFLRPGQKYNLFQKFH